MANIATEVINNHLLRSPEHVLQLISNILAALEEHTRVTTEEQIRELFDTWAINQVPWEDQLVKLQMKILKSDQLDAQTKDKINAVILSEFEKAHKATKDRDNAEGLNDLKRLFNKSRLPNEDKCILNKMINQALYELHDPHHIVVDRGAYHMMVQMLNQQNLMNQVSAIQAVSGDYVLLYNEALEPQIQLIAQIVGLYQGKLPRPELEDIKGFIQAAEDTEHKGQGSLIKFSGLSPELAEKAVMESTKSKHFSFAKEKREDGRYDIYCFGGIEQDEKARYYKEAVQTLALAAFSLTGPTKELESKKAIHSDKEYSKITRVLECIENDVPDEEDAGYIYSIHAITDNNNNRFILTDDYIKFDSDSFTASYNGNDSIVRASNEEFYLRTLRMNIQSGPGQKVYISESKMQELHELAKEATRVYASLTASNRVDQVAECINRREDLYSQLQKAQDNIEKRVFVKEMAILSIVSDALLLHSREEITPEKILSRTIANELSKHEFKGYASKDLSKETIDNARINNIAFIDYLKNSSKIDALEPAYASINDLTEALQQANFSHFINEEIAKADASQDQQQTERFTTEDVEHEMAALNTHYKQRCHEAELMLDGIQMSIEHVAPDKTQEINTHNTIGRHQKAQKFIKALLSGQTPAEAMQFAKSREKTITRSHQETIHEK